MLALEGKCRYAQPGYRRLTNDGGAVVPLLAFRQVLDLGFRAVDRRRAGSLPHSTIGRVTPTLWMMNRRMGGATIAMLGVT